MARGPESALPALPAISAHPIEPLRAIALVSSYVPRRCGIATFTHDLVVALRQQSPETRLSVVALDDAREDYDYPDEVRFEVAERQIQDYRAAADFLNANHVDAVCVQHEFGIFGGADGSHLLKLLGSLRTPVVTTFHTVLNAPSASQRAIVREVAARSERLVVMSKTALRFLAEIYGVPENRVRVVPHGIPDIPFVDPNYYKDQFGVAGRKVLLTFGLLSRNKGIEQMIRALPKVAKRHPEAVYVVLGATHPQVKRSEGESYRLELQQLARRLGVDDRVIFDDRFVELQELAEYLGAADVYVTPYLNVEQIVSGTLSYAMGAGKAVVSTPYWYATEMLGEGRGRIVPPGEPDALADAIAELFDDEATRHAMRKRAYTFTRDAVWSEVARRYLEVLEDVRAERAVTPRPTRVAEARERMEALPGVDLSHLRRLTDDVGIFQHATYAVPARGHGYCTDDNARALAVVVQAQPFVDDPAELDELAVRFLGFLGHARDSLRGGFRNFLGYDRRFADERGSPDCHGRAVFALAIVAAQTSRKGLRAFASQLLHDGLAGIEGYPDLRPAAYALLGFRPFLEQFPGDSVVKRMRQTLAEKLLAAFAGGAKDADWAWPEEKLTYANAILPHALIETGRPLGRDDMVEQGLRSLEWLTRVQAEDGRFAPVGNQGWFVRGGARARFDQQPIDASASVAACAAAFEASGDSEWLERALSAFRWFLGENDVGQPLYDPTTGGCRDGISANGVNENQGAESTLCWIAALIRMLELESAGRLGGRVESSATRNVAAAGGGAGT